MMTAGTRKFTLGMIGVILLWVAGMFAPGIKEQPQIREVIFSPMGSIVGVITLTVAGNVMEHFSRKG